MINNKSDIKESPEKKAEAVETQLRVALVVGEEGLAQQMVAASAEGAVGAVGQNSGGSSASDLQQQQQQRQQPAVAPAVEENNSMNPSGTYPQQQQQQAMHSMSQQQPQYALHPIQMGMGMGMGMGMSMGMPPFIMHHPQFQMYPQPPVQPSPQQPHAFYPTGAPQMPYFIPHPSIKCFNIWLNLHRSNIISNYRHNRNYNSIITSTTATTNSRIKIIRTFLYKCIKSDDKQTEAHHLNSLREAVPAF
ncbi:hypothetical protein BCR33DRAFT_62376 [Rhizoclosmatium globosum]|uniref:Uncharacterized protein n=1 Tax=Rhizoclosmatium globosum TaxID=329046 RepID=A0A1Y2CMJ1_9FUNG|nr:hypothetical protein BCR33DRAFT_62376 [Rhizoclosmatium globosum]|eukprot:ORY48241.1 hypothetical protein BCR33DRAFT_62376 [Rhizoclosmatium globosum]